MVFVTGATGLVGTHVMLELISRGEQIKALRRKSSSLNQVESLFHFYLGDKAQDALNNIEWVEGDILDVTVLDEAVKNCSRVFHCAAVVSFVQRDFKKMMKINKHGTANVVNVCLTNDIDHLCYVSSTAALGRNSNSDIYTEVNKWVNSPDNSNYAVSKYSAENEIWRGVEEGLDAVIINPSVILGPGDWNQSSLSIFKVVKKGLKFYTPGANAFVDVRDVATCLCELSDKKMFNDRYLVFSENLSFQELFQKIAKAFNVKGPSILVKQWMVGIAWRTEALLRFLFGKKQNITKETAKSSMKTSVYSNEKIKNALDFEFISIDHSIKHSVPFFEKHFS